MNDKIQERQDKSKELIIEQLKKTSIVEYSCKKANIGRASYYRWRKEDKSFAEMADQAITEGSKLISDLAESQLISAIKDQNMTAIIFYLKAHHPAYRNRVELSTTEKPRDELTIEQQEVVKKALSMGNLIEGEENNDKSEQN
ncbi:hypothetical protein KKA15_03615 [Patescibacteria group bacterium]|nr:hypothetical protein [Patescibacteria group bacterium]